LGSSGEQMTLILKVGPLYKDFFGREILWE